MEPCLMSSIVRLRSLDFDGGEWESPSPLLGVVAISLLKEKFHECQLRPPTVTRATSLNTSEDCKRKRKRTTKGVRPLPPDT
jgi:hypothetical protein